MFHTHIDDLVIYCDTVLNIESIVLMHFSARYRGARLGRSWMTSYDRN
jgi:hypothetical protein